MCDTPFPSRWLACFWSAWLPLLANQISDFLLCANPSFAPLFLGLFLPLFLSLLFWNPWILPGALLVAGSLGALVFLFCLSPSQIF